MLATAGLLVSFVSHLQYVLETALLE